MVAEIGRAQPVEDPDPKRFEEQIEEFVQWDTKNSLTEVDFLYATIKPSSSRWSYWETMTEANRQIKEYNRQNEQLFYVDLATPLLKNGQPNDSLFMDDLLHLNEKGYAVWDRIIASELNKLLKSK